MSVSRSLQSAAKLARDPENKRICHCDHAKSWHHGRYTFWSACRYPDCHCDGFKGRK